MIIQFCLPLPLHWHLRRAEDIERKELILNSNEGARKLYGKMGFVLEGVQREYVFMDGKFHDTVEFSLLEDEWREKVEKGEW